MTSMMTSRRLFIKIGLGGSKNPEILNFLNRMLRPLFHNKSSSSILPTRQPSQTFQPPPSPSQQPSFALLTRQASFAQNDDANIINFSDPDFAASAFTAPPPRRGRGQLRKTPLPTVAEHTDSLATHPAEGGGEGQSPDEAAEAEQENIQVNFIEEQGDWVMLLRQKRPCRKDGTES